MRPNRSNSATNPPVIEKAYLSAHNKKIQKRVDDFMDTINTLIPSPTGKLTCLKYLLDNDADILSDSKAAQPFNEKFSQFINELQVALKQSKKESNRQEFLTSLENALAREGLGDRYDNYVSNKSLFSTQKLLEWIGEQQTQINLPKVRNRSRSQPVLTVTTDSDTPSKQTQTSTTSTQATVHKRTATATTPFEVTEKATNTKLRQEGIPQPIPQVVLQASVPHQTYQQMTPQPYGSYPATMQQPFVSNQPYPQSVQQPYGNYPRYPPSLQQPFVSNQPYTQQVQQPYVNYPSYPPTVQQPFVSNQPYTQQVPQPYDNYPSYPPSVQQPYGSRLTNPQTLHQSAFAAPTQTVVQTATASQQAPQSVDVHPPLTQTGHTQLNAASTLFNQANFNRQGTITVLKYLVNAEVPAPSNNPAAQRFNNKFFNFKDTFDGITRQVNRGEYANWNLQAILKFSEKHFNPTELQRLAVALRSGESPQSITDWLNTLYTSS